MYLLTKENDILSIRDQYALCDEILKNRLEELMPQLLKECGVDMWLVICREYNEDPVFKTLTPQLVKNASRTSCFIFSLDSRGEYEALSLSRPTPGWPPSTSRPMTPAPRTSTMPSSRWWRNAPPKKWR